MNILINKRKKSFISLFIESEKIIEFSYFFLPIRWVLGMCTDVIELDRTWHVKFGHVRTCPNSSNCSNCPNCPTVRTARLFELFEPSELVELSQLSESGLSISNGSEARSALELVENGLKRRTETQKVTWFVSFRWNLILRGFRGCWL